MLGKKLRRYLIALGVGVLALAAVPAAGFGQADGYRNLEPGERADLDEKVPVNFVFVGYDATTSTPASSSPDSLDRYKPIVRSRYFYNESIGKSLLGLNYTYDYNVKFADTELREEVLRVPVGRGEARAPHGLPEAVQRQLAPGSATRRRVIPNPARKGAYAISRRTTT